MYVPTLVAYIRRSIYVLRVSSVFSKKLNNVVVMTQIEFSNGSKFQHLVCVYLTGCFLETECYC